MPSLARCPSHRLSHGPARRRCRAAVGPSRAAPQPPETRRIQMSNHFILGHGPSNKAGHRTAFPGRNHGMPLAGLTLIRRHWASAGRRCGRPGSPIPSPSPVGWTAGPRHLLGIAGISLSRASALKTVKCTLPVTVGLSPAGLARSPDSDLEGQLSQNVHRSKICCSSQSPGRRSSSRHSRC